MFANTIKIALKSIFSNKTRSFLTMLGIIIGVMAVVMLVSIGYGATDTVTGTIAGMGSTLITGNITDENVSVSEEDMETLQANPAIDAVAPVITSNMTVKGGGTSYSTSVVGVNENYETVRGYSVQFGRNIAASDDEWKTSVAVIGTDVATEVFGKWDVVGEQLTIDTKVYTIVGVLNEIGSSTRGSSDDMVIVPLSSMKSLSGQSRISTYYVKAADEDGVSRAQNALESKLLELSRDEESFTVYNQSEVLSTMSEVQNTMALMLSGIAAISLLVGGIGIMNIMLVSVTERTREIGVRKAIGAKARYISTQFLLEACLLSVAGGIIGIVLSILGIQIYNLVMSSTISMSYVVAFGALCFCAVIGVGFGGYPAVKASRLTPIDALRYM